jgi:hypothetical protein
MGSLALVGVKNSILLVQVGIAWGFALYGNKTLLESEDFIDPIV